MYTIVGIWSTVDLRSAFVTPILTCRLLTGEIGKDAFPDKEEYKGYWKFAPDINVGAGSEKNH